jgi:thiamine-phosphate pyrophosphorylase
MARCADPLHLLLGLLDEEEGQAALLLSQAGLDLTALQRRYTSASGPKQDLPLPPPGAAIEDLLLRARQRGRDWGIGREVSSPAVLLELLETDGELAECLKGQGLDIDRLRCLVLPGQGPPLRMDDPLDLSTPAEQIDVARLLDANAKRGREALGVVADYCRLVLDDPILNRLCQQLRDDLDAFTENLLVSWPPTGVAEMAGETTNRLLRPDHRVSLLQVVRDNLQRLRQALGGLVQFGNVGESRQNKDLTGLHLNLDLLEQAILLGTTARQRLASARLYVLLTGSLCTAGLDWTIHEAAAGGASIIQLREKDLDDRRFLERARQVRRWTSEAGVLFILNDRPDVARLVGADGVHLGQEDLPIQEARRILGPDALIGVSTHNLEEVRQAVLDGASYIGVGPTFPSTTKRFTEFAGLDFVRQVLAETTLPAFVIGGVSRETVAAVVAVGASRVAVSAAVARADDPRAAAAELLAALGVPRGK